MALHGYAGQILCIDLSAHKVSTLPVSDYSRQFIGGRGIAARLYWDMTSPETAALDPENGLAFITGPVAGFMGFSGCRWQICGKSPMTDPEAFSYASLGGSWGSWLKYAGYDGLIVLGRAERPVYIHVNSREVRISDAAHLWGKTTVETESTLRSGCGKDARVMSIGPAGENLVTFATVLASENASGSSGFGAVMGSKNLKAVVVTANDRRIPTSADPQRLRDLAHLVRSMRIRNFEDYGHILPGDMKLTACYGCISGCTRFIYRAEDDRVYKSFCQAAGVFVGPAIAYYGKSKGAAANLLAGRLCDRYGIDTAVLSPMIGWLERCYRNGVLSEEETGLPLSRIGSVEFIQDLVGQLCNRQGFGDVLAQGVATAARSIGKGSDLFGALSLGRSGESMDYDPRLILTNAIGYATEPRRAVHIHHATVLPLKRWLNWTEKRWSDAFMTTDILSGIAREHWGGIDSLDFSSYSGKALAAMRVQDYAYAKESLILCDLVWPLYQVRDIDRSIGFCTMESSILNAITGQNTGEDDLLKIGERVFNLQRAILMRQGWGGRKGDTLPDFLFTAPVRSTFFDPECLVSDRNGAVISRKGAVIDRAAFETLKDEYYALRGWDVASGLQTASRLAELGLQDVAEDLATRGLVAGLRNPGDSAIDSGPRPM